MTYKLHPVDPKQFSISIAAPACISVVLVAPGVGNAGENSTNHKKHFFILLLSGVCAGNRDEIRTGHRPLGETYEWGDK